MKTIICVAALSLLLSACSGGGGGSDGASSGGTTPTVAAQPQPQPAIAQQLGAYVGTWAADCANHELEYATITRVSDDTVKVASKTDYYAGADCTGAIVGTQTDTGDVPTKYAGSADASVVLPPAATASAVKVDLITADVPAYSQVVTGSGVTRTTRDGVAQWCMTFDDESSTCIQDDGVHQGGSSTGALYAQGGNLYVLSRDGSGYTAERRLTKK